MISLDEHTPESEALEIAVREKECRRRRGLTQSQLAQHAGVSLGSLRRFEQTGQVSLDSLLRLGFALACADDFDALFSEKEYSSIQEVIADAKRNQ